jgi:GT2 family glycosyltransferase
VTSHEESKSRPDVSVIVVNWNTGELLSRCLDSVDAEWNSVALEVIVVDNGSTDGSQALVEEAHPSDRLIANPDNRGFSIANNQGISASSGRYVLLLNSDTEVERDSLRVLVDYGDSHAEAGILGPRLLNSDGTLQPSGGRFPTPLGTALALLGLARLTGRPRYGTKRDYAKPAVVDEVSGAAMMIRREVVEQIGGLDESFRWGYEDVDLCRRARRAGWQVHYVPGAAVKHEWGASRRLAPASTVLMAAKGRGHYFRKHHGAAASTMVMSATVASHFMRSVVFGAGGLVRRGLSARASVEWEVLRRLMHRSA